MDPAKDEFSSYIWQIDNFSNSILPTNPGGAMYICSPDFYFKKHNFYLRFYPQDSLDNMNRCALVCLMREEPFKGDIRVVCRISVIDSKKQKCLTNEFEAKFEAKRAKRLSINGGIYFILRDHILDETNGLLLNDTLTIYCEIKELTDAKGKQYNAPEFDSLLESGQFSDVVFVIGKEQKKEFRLHKNILASRCPVFAAMFTNDCEEKRKNRVEITDISVSVFEEMIRYIYTGKIGQGLELYAEELIVVADKYQLDQLKSTTEMDLSSKLTAESVSRMLLLADMHNAEQLKMDCIEYINKHAIEVIQTDAWSKLIEPRSDLMAMLYRDIVSSK